MKTIFYGMRYLSPEIWNVNLLFVSCVWLEQRVCYFRIGFVAAIHFYNILSITLWRFSLFSWEYEWVGMVEGIGGGGRGNSILHCCIPTLLTLLLFCHKTSHIISSPPYFKFKIRLSLVSTEESQWENIDSNWSGYRKEILRSYNATAGGKVMLSNQILRLGSVFNDFFSNNVFMKIKNKNKLT